MAFVSLLYLLSYHIILAMQVTIWESMFVDRAGMEPLIGETIHKWVPNIPINICSVGDYIVEKVSLMTTSLMLPSLMTASVMSLMSLMSLMKGSSSRR